MNTIIQAVKGTRDFYPPDLARRSWLYEKMRTVSSLFGYQEYDGPFLERLELYAAKSGDELVKKQSFAFKDKDGREVTLRPELTLSLARMVASRQNNLSFPLRWWSFGPFWRYEAPQKGRSREFYQWNIDLVGNKTALADAELIGIGCEFLKNCGLKPDQVKILLNNRELMDKKLASLGIDPEKKKTIFQLIDRTDKVKEEEWIIQAREAGLSQSQVTGLVALLKNDQLWRESDDLTATIRNLELTGYQDYVGYDPHIIRGLDYYTGTVFEARDMDGEYRAVLGGGRYDNLVGDVGGTPVGGVGFAMGDVVIGLVLEKYGCYPENIDQNPAKCLVTVFDENSGEATLRIARILRTSGVPTAIYPEAAKLGKQFKYADRQGIRIAVVAGPDEVREGKVALKDLNNGEQFLVSESEMVPEIWKRLAEGDSA